jgi:cholesterol transport system auxiliary component
MILVSCLLVVLGVAGCFSPRQESQPSHTYRLGLDPDRSETRPPDSNGPILLVSVPVAEPGYETTRMVYLKRPHELEYYAVNQWADHPARMFASLLVQALERTGSWRAVVPLPASTRGDLRLDTYGFSVQQEFMQSPSRVRVSVRAQLVDLKESRVVGARSFERVESAPTEDAYGGVLAANRATAAVLDDTVSWLKECARRSSECGR